MKRQQTIRNIGRGISICFYPFLLVLFVATASEGALRCYDCHGTRATADYRPVDAPFRNASSGGFPGNHRTHMPATAEPSSCNVCHPESDGYAPGHRDGTITLSPQINDSPLTTGYGNKSTQFPQTSNPALGSCTNVNCHFESETPVWGSSRLTSPVGCSTCHGAPPSDGNHPSLTGAGVKHGQYYGTGVESCGKCHDAHDSENAPFAHATSAGKRALRVRFADSPSGSYTGNIEYPSYLPSSNSARNGTCLNVSCHYNAQATWGATLDCMGCHGNDPHPAFTSIAGEPNFANEGTGRPRANSHEKHAKQGAATCYICHSETTGTGTSIKPGSVLHVNHKGDVTFDVAKAGSAAVWTAADKSCSNVSCHNGTGITWGGALPSDCTGCHGNDSASGNPLATGAHGAHLGNNPALGTGNAFSCTECHANTVTGNRIIGGGTAHANGMKDYSGARSGQISTAGSGKCSVVYCHSTGASPNLFWNMTGAHWYSSRTLSCNGCHGTPVRPDGATAAFASSAGEPNYQNISGIGQRNSHRKHVADAGIADSTGCTACHARTVDPVTPGKLRNYSTAHLSGTRDVAFAKTIQGRYSAATGQCMNTYCHGTLPSPRWGGGPLSCNKCHEAGKLLGGAHGSHWTGDTEATSYAAPAGNEDSTGSTYRFACSSCHGSPASHSNGVADSASGAAAQVHFGYSTAGWRGSYQYGTSSSPDSRGFAYSAGQSGTCSTTYCHSSGAGGSGNVLAFDWNSPAGTLGCSGCHGGNAASSSPMDSNAHGRHVNNADVIGVNFACAECHGGTVATDTAIADKAAHVNRYVDYTGSKAGGRANYDASTKQCSSIYCHSNGKQGTTAVAYADPPSWTSGGALGCNGCHGTGNAKGAPDYVSGGPGTASANSHQRHTLSNALAPEASCGACHRDTTANGTAIRKDISPPRHLSGSPDIFFNITGGSYDHSTRSCSTYCHSNGAPFDRAIAHKPVTWGGASQTCSSCHDGAGLSTGLSGRHGRHTGGSYSLTCERCHSTTASGSTAIAAKGLHVNAAKDVSFREGGVYSAGKGCNSTYCHSDGRGGQPVIFVNWSSSNTAMACYSCHKGRTADSVKAACDAIQGVWSASRGYCTPAVTMSSNGHERLVGLRWIRKYPCTFCHNSTVSAVTDANGNIVGDGAINLSQHLNGQRNVTMASQWNIVGRPASSYDPATKTCYNVYCHSDGTSNPDTVRPFPWTAPKTECNTCHGHPKGSCANVNCHDGRIDSTGKQWVLHPVYGSNTSYEWPAGQEWKASIPMFPNQGPGTARANSHMRHTETDFTCDKCHASTTVNGTCTDCHVDSIPPGSMTEVAHLNADFHANKSRDVAFEKGVGSYNHVTKTCSGTGSKCHASGTDPQWGGSVNNTVICLNCHGTTTGDIDSYQGVFDGVQAKINQTDWTTSGHGRPGSSGPYPASGNPAANFPGNPCWYCHDNYILHKDNTNPFRLRQHPQFSNRFEKECVYCHMTGSDPECLACHNTAGSLAPQLASIEADPSATWPNGTPAPQPDHRGMTDGRTSCLTSQCHYIDPARPADDLKVHNEGAGFWSQAQKEDVRNQYMMMGVCLKCHDDDSGGKCSSCHTAPENNPFKYALGFKAYSGFPTVKPQKAVASSVHFGYKHYRGLQQNGIWKGGKFCWDCHDPHGDSVVNENNVRTPNIYMIHSKVATATDGTYGIPTARADVVFTRKQSGLDYVRMEAPYTGICNVCHSAGSQHFRSDGGDGHMVGRVCTSCHEHRFTDSHADNKSCSDCHRNKPVPRHSGFGLPRDCTKCHAGTIGMRMDVMGQMKANSHHVQGVEVTNKHCYACHWESTPDGLIDLQHHEGYNYKNYTTIKNAKVDLVVWKPGERPTYYNTTTAVKFLASNIGTASERTESAKLNDHCISCHSDGNNDTIPFNDCRTPRQYAWDEQSVAARYSQTGTTPWGKYNSTTYAAANQKDKVTKSFSAHGNAVNNQGGYNAATGIDSSITNLRGGSQNVTCFDCHSSHGSKVVGVTSSYVTFNGTRNGGNLKETQAGKGGYAMSYKASANPSGSVNPYNAGAGQCFDCHMNQNTGTTPWGYQSTYGATAPIKGYFDSDFFGTGLKPSQVKYPVKANKRVTGGHLKGTAMLNYTTSADNRIGGLCTPCHDPHGISPTLGSKQSYAVPLLKGTWLTSPYRDDAPQANTVDALGGARVDDRPVFTDQKTFGGKRINEDDAKFAGLCLRCHKKEKLSDGSNKNQPWGSIDRVHESVKGWGGNSEHSYSCSKCHAPHVSGLPRLSITNCLDYRHRGNVASGGRAGANSGEWAGVYYPTGPGSGSGSFPRGGIASTGVNCHPAGNSLNGAWPDNYWNTKTKW